MTSRRVILVCDWNDVLDPDIDRTWTRSGTNNLDVKLFRDFIDRLDLVDKFQIKFP